MNSMLFLETARSTYTLKHAPAASAYNALPASCLQANHQNRCSTGFVVNPVVAAAIEVVDQ